MTLLLNIILVKIVRGIYEEYFYFKGVKWIQNESVKYFIGRRK